MRFFFIALLINSATTLLSTPPDKAQITLSFFTVFLISLINLFFCEVMFHSFLILQILNKKFLKILFPLSVWVTSGWNWTPYILSFVFSIIVNFENKQFYIILFLLFFLMESIYAQATVNYGTALRHHMTSIGYLILLLFFPLKTKFRKSNWNLANLWKKKYFLYLIWIVFF